MTRACSRCGTAVLVNWATKATRNRIRVHSVGYRGVMPGVARCEGSGELPGGVGAPPPPIDVPGKPLRLRPKMVEVPLDHARYALVVMRANLDRVAQPARANAMIESFTKAIAGDR